MVASPSFPAPRRRPPRGLVVRDIGPEEAAAGVDWSSWYLTEEEDRGEGAEQGEIIRLLLSSLHELARERGWTEVYLGADQFFAWLEAEPLVRVSPDVYLLDRVPPGPLPRMWQTWLPGHRPPRFALEVVSTEWKKDYEDNPPKYAQLGARELWLFDPEAPTGHAERVVLQSYQRQSDGALARVYGGAGPAWSPDLGVYLLPVLLEGRRRVRVSHDADGVRLVPTETEARKAADERVRALEDELRALRGESRHR